MTPEDKVWQNLVSAARSVRDDRATGAPYGFATRVVAQAFAAESRPAPLLLDRFCWRALSVAGLLAVAGVAANYTVGLRSEEEMPLDETAVTAVFDIS